MPRRRTSKQKVRRSKKRKPRRKRVTHKRQSRKRKSRRRVVNKHGIVKSLAKLKAMKESSRKKALLSANRPFIQDLSSAVRRLRHSNMPVSAAQKKAISKHTAFLRKMADPRISYRSKRKTLVQKGGIAPALIPLIAAAIGAAGTVGASAAHAAISK